MQAGNVSGIAGEERHFRHLTSLSEKGTGYQNERGQAICGNDQRMGAFGADK